MKVPFNRGVSLENPLESLGEALRSGSTSGNGPFGKKCEGLLEGMTKRPALLVSSGSHALDMMPLLLNFRPGDEVILPSFTFSSTANAFALRGARLRFADNDEFGNIAVSEVERLINKNTKAVMVMHYAGNSADIDAILELCRAKGVPLLEDAAQAIGGTYKGRVLGTLGALGCYSFHDTKNISAGEGGALLCGDSSYLERAKVFREKGTNRSAFLQGLVDKYSWVDMGSSYILSDLNAAYLWPQLQQFERIQARRGEIWRRYETELCSFFEKQGARILGTPAYNTPNFHMFAVVFPSGKMRNDFIAHMRNSEVTCPFHYIPLHSSAYGKSLAGGEPESLPECDRISQCLVRLPVFFNLTDDEQAFVIERAKKFQSAPGA